MKTLRKLASYGFFGFLGIVGSQVSLPVMATDPPAYHWVTVTEYRTVTQPYTCYVTKYKPCGTPFQVAVTKYRTVRVPYQKTVRVCD